MATRGTTNTDLNTYKLFTTKRRNQRGNSAVPSCASSTSLYSHPSKGKVKIVVNSTTGLDTWSTNLVAYATPEMGTTTVSLTAGVAVPIEVDYWNETGVAKVSLFSKVGAGSALEVPADQLRPEKADADLAVPRGWSE